MSTTTETTAKVPEAKTAQRGRLTAVGMGASATVLAVLCAMVHWSHIGARLEGPSGWTPWVVLDVALVPLPVLAPIIAFVALLVTGRTPRESGHLALTVYLAASLVSTALALFWF